MIANFVNREQQALARHLRHSIPQGIIPLQHAMERGWRKAARHGDWPRWAQAIKQLPHGQGHVLDASNDIVCLGHAHPDQDLIRRQLLELHPWRKGPFRLFGVHIDTEWRSDMKWRRLHADLPELRGCTVLDIGCGSGYHLWRMHACGATAIGIDPTPLFAAQFMACKRATPEAGVFYLPIGIEQFPDLASAFDAVFSMGVLYHRKSPIDHLEHLRALLKPGGYAFLETLIVEDCEDRCLVPVGRYAKMRNVWFIPSPSVVETWLARTGFDEIRCLDITPTTSDEQRRTAWMRFESLSDFLDPDNPQRTIEGYPAPVRAIWRARRCR